jgi:hypothetical protein
VVSGPTWSAIPARRSTEMELAVRRRLLVSLVILAMLSGPMSLFISLAMRPAPVAPIVQTTDDEAALASIAVQDFINGVPTKVQVASDDTIGAAVVNPLLRSDGLSAPELEPLGATSFAYAGAVVRTVNGRTFKIHTFWVGTADTLYRVGVVTTRNEAGEPVLAGHPSLLPAEYQVSAPTAPIDFAEDAGALSGAPLGLNSQVLKWASAFAGDDRVALKEVVDNPGVFRGLGGFVVVDAPRILTVVIDGREDWLNVRVRIELASVTRPGFRVTADYDLLVKPVGDLPKILSWGPAGSTGTPLQAYANAVDPNTPVSTVRPTNPSVPDGTAGSDAAIGTNGAEPSSGTTPTP